MIVDLSAARFCQSSEIGELIGIDLPANMHNDEFPVHHNARLRFWTFSRHADVLGALQAPELFISGKGVYVGVPDYDDGKITAQVPLLITTYRPRHTQLRALVSRAFTPRRIARPGSASSRGREGSRPGARSS